MNNYLKGISEANIQKAEKIKLLITDVDGVLTDGGIIFDNVGVEYKRFNVKDGFIVAPLSEKWHHGRCHHRQEFQGGRKPM
jgi:3-deoxy-D-manno-octulosonate 8-phosphate phosphatase (KDO 8-P phosphatase)